MREILHDVSRWLSAGNTGIAIATVLKTFGSAPRKEGAKLAYLSSGSLAGSISGGCVESAILDEAADVLRSGIPKIVHFDTSDDDAWEVGLPCGGSIDVRIEPLNPATFEFCRSLIERNERTVQITVVSAGHAFENRTLVIGSSGDMSGDMPEEYRERAFAIAREARASGRLLLDDQTELFVDLTQPVPTLVVVGGVHTAMALVRMARVLGFRTVVIDPRQTFSAAERFPEVDRLIDEWPQKAFELAPLTADCAMVVLTHDPKLDDPALEVALRSDAFYIGALGSVRTQQKRTMRLGALGFNQAALSRIHGPVGLDIGSVNPEQVALSILTEIVAVMNGRDGGISQKRMAMSGRLAV